MVIMKFLTQHEEVTYQKLRLVCDPLGARVFAKVRLIDVLRCYPTPPTGNDLSFSLKAHLDFVVVSETGTPLFSVEYDGPNHQYPTQARRDLKKNTMLNRIGHPLLRINSRYLDRRYRGYDLLSYFVDVWFLWESFNQAQEEGQVPSDEPFDPDWLQPCGHLDRRPWPWHLSYDLRKGMRNLHKHGKVIQPIPNYLIGADGPGNTRCLAWIFMTPSSGVLVHTGMRQQYFPAVDSTEVLTHLAMFDLYDLLTSALNGRRTPQSPDQILAEIRLFIDRYSLRASCTGSQTVSPNFKNSVLLFSNQNA